ncbi:MAG: agmatinase [Fimbriimonadaceae bacterium]|nr:agmatinase [Alphaproteobacteria bacterium]
MTTDTKAMFDPRYMGIATFMRAPYSPDPAGLDVAMIGVPYDGGVTNRAGARHGPREIRNASSLVRGINPVTRKSPFDLCNVADIGDVPFTSLYDPAVTNDEITAFYRDIVASGVRPLTAGGDHSISYPILRAVAAERPVALIHFDAHCDTWDVFQGSKFNHGAPFRRANEDGLIDPGKTLQIGIRGGQIIPDGWDYSAAAGMRVIFMHEVESIGIEGIIRECRDLVGDDPVYLTFDNDGLDPVYAPGTGTPEVGGFTTREALELLRGLHGLNIVGGDVVEVAPPFDVGSVTALAGATMMYEILCLMATAVEIARG